MREIILIKVSGQDSPGLTWALTDVLAQHCVNILDISQAVIHDSLSLGLLVELPAESESSPILKELLYTAHTRNLGLKFIPVDEGDYEKWVLAQGKKRYIITLLGRQLTAAHLGAVARIVTENDLNIDFMTRLTGRVSFVNPDLLPRACVEISVRGTPRSPSEMRASFMELSKNMGIDIGFQEDNAFRRNRRLVAFDMDSTLIQAEVIDELAVEVGAGEEVARITERAMRGELDFKESLTERVALLKGLNQDVLEKVAARLPLTEGALRLVKTLKSLGYKIAILSGGFSYFGSHLQAMLGVDYVFANNLEIKNRMLTGRIEGEIVDGAKKAELLRHIAMQEKIDLNQVIAVGDGANDLPMLDIAGLGVAFHAKPVVKKEAGQAISNLGLDSLLYLLGIRDREVSEQQEERVTADG